MVFTVVLLSANSIPSEIGDEALEHFFFKLSFHYLERKKEKKKFFSVCCNGFLKPFTTQISHDIGIHFTVFYLLLMVQYSADSIFREMEKITTLHCHHYYLPAGLPLTGKKKRSLIIICHVLAFGNYYQASSSSILEFRGRFFNFSFSQDMYNEIEEESL